MLTDHADGAGAQPALAAFTDVGAWPTPQHGLAVRRDSAPCRQCMPAGPAGTAPPARASASHSSSPQRAWSAESSARQDGATRARYRLDTRVGGAISAAAAAWRRKELPAQLDDLGYTALAADLRATIVEAPQLTRLEQSVETNHHCAPWLSRGARHRSSPSRCLNQPALGVL